MLFASLILSIAFIGCVCVLIKAGGDEKSSYPVIEYRQPDIHIHNNNNSHGGYSNSHGGCATTNNTTTDNVSEEMIRQEIENLREDIKRKQQLYMETLEQLNEFDRIINNK